MAKRWPGRLISGLAGSWSLRFPRVRHSRSLRARRTTDGDRVLAHFTSADVTNAKRPVGRVSKDPAIGASTVTEPTLPPAVPFSPTLYSSGSFLTVPPVGARRAGARPSVEPGRSSSARSVVLISLPARPYGSRVCVACARRRRAAHPASATSRLPLLGRRSHPPSRSAHRARS